VPTFLEFHKKVHWSDCDAAGIVWFPNFHRWFEDAEEELFTVTLGRTRQALLDARDFGMPRVETSTKYRSPARAGQLIRIGIFSTLENPRRLRHDFEMRDDATATLLAEGFVRVACVDMKTFTPRDFPEDVLQMVAAQPAAAAKQHGAGTLPWV
jgi:acyl-CoA thioesterase FadM